MVRVRQIAEYDCSAWRDLWSAYNFFYRVNIDEVVTQATWDRMIASKPSLIGRVAENQDNRIIGFSISVIHDGSWSTSPTCYLEDLFVARDHRGKGVGKALIEDLVKLGLETGWSSIYWHTRADNVAARKLYDRFVKADDFVRYRLFLEDRRSQPNLNSTPKPPRG